MTDGSNLQKAQLQNLSHVRAASFRLLSWATSAPLKPCAKSHAQRRRSKAVAPCPGDTRGRLRHAMPAGVRSPHISLRSGELPFVFCYGRHRLAGKWNARHLSLSSPSPPRAPNPDKAWGRPRAGGLRATAPVAAKLACDAANHSVKLYSVYVGNPSGIHPSWYRARAAAARIAWPARPLHTR